MALIEVREDLPLGEFNFAIRAWNVHIIASVCKEMLLLVGKLVETHFAICERTFEWALSCVDPQVIKHIWEFPKEFSTIVVVAGEYSTKLPCFFVLVELELGELFGHRYQHLVIDVF